MRQTNRPKVLFYDIESSPLLGYTYGLYDTTIIHVERDSHLLSFSYKWQGERRIRSHSLPDYRLYKKDRYDDTELLKDLHALMDSADLIVAHNGDRFDVRMANMRFIQKGLPSLPIKKSIDTLKIARSRFRFTSNSSRTWPSTRRLERSSPPTRTCGLTASTGTSRHGGAW